MKIIITVMVVVAMLMLNGCSSVVDDVEGPADTYIDTGKGVLSDSEFVKQELYNQHRQWRGIKYRSGGLDKSGIDCSGLIYITFKHRFGLILPRSTEEMADIGEFVEEGDWRAGDLLFFKTGIVTRHVGVYIEDGRFLHVSSIKGVIISSLNNNYWRNTYWKAKRI
ncbi:MAG: C40 family peptidase [Desulfamplus sp.]|nr:C40 family peptidase [Desulfamplus sp.]